MTSEVRRPDGMTPAEARRWDEQVEVIRNGFEFELCRKCGDDFGGHIIAAGPLGNAVAVCKVEVN